VVVDQVGVQTAIAGEVDILEEDAEKHVTDGMQFFFRVEL